MQANYATQSATLAVNADDVRTEELQGREHVVASVTLVREMVLKGEFLPFEEIQLTQLAWNGKPGTITHPVNQDGDFVPASHPDQFDSHVTATLFGVETSSSSRALEGEIWIDVERSAELAETLDRDDPAEMLLDDETIEVSIGYWYQRFEANGEHDGNEYDAVQHTIQPDHLALLPNGTGECSIEDGCGANRTDTTGAAMNGDEDASPSSGAPFGLSMIQRGLNYLGVNTDGNSGFGAACEGCGGTCGAHDDDGDASNTNDTDNGHMTDITKLAENSAFDAETLEEWDEEALESLEESLDLSDDGGSGDDPGPQDGQNSNQGGLTADDVEEIVNSALEEDRKKRTEPQREQLTAQITAQTSLTEEQLPEDLEALEALANEVAPSRGVYPGAAGAGGAAQSNGDGSDIPVGLGDRYLEGQGQEAE